MTTEFSGAAIHTGITRRSSSPSTIILIGGSDENAFCIVCMLSCVISPGGFFHVSTVLILSSKGMSH